MWHGCEIRCIGLDEQSVFRHESQQRIIDPSLEGNDAAEGHVPTGIESGAREVV